ncbi:MAG: hypothetical protein ACJAXA_002336 [Candidatus Aldehydirespiratoraceae bacterium]|jgi:hypothetical protein
MMRSGLPSASTAAATTYLVDEVPKVWPASLEVPPRSSLMLLVGSVPRVMATAAPIAAQWLRPSFMVVT